MVASILRSEGEKRDFSIVLAYLLLTHSLSNVKFENVLPLRAIRAEKAAFEVAADETALKFDLLNIHDNGMPSQPGEIMQWLTSFQFFRPTENDMLTYFLKGESTNDRDDLSQALLGQLPLPPVEPRPTTIDDEMFALEAALRDVEGVSLNDAQEDFATGLSLAEAENQTFLPQFYNRFNSFDAFVSEVTSQNFLPLESQINCLCIDGKPTLVAPPNRFTLDIWPSGGNELMDDKNDVLLADCAAQSPCGDETSNANMNSTDSTPDSTAFLPERTFEHLLAEVGSANDFDYEGLKQLAYGTNQTTLDDVKPPSASDHNYATTTTTNSELQDVVQQEVGFVEAFSQLPQTSDDESGIHSDSMIDYDLEQNAFGGYNTPSSRPEGIPYYTDYLSDGDYMRAQLNRATMQATAATNNTNPASVEEIPEFDDCVEEFDEVMDEEFIGVLDSFTVPKSSGSSVASNTKPGSFNRRKRNASDDTTESTWNEADDESNTATQFNMNTFTANLPYSDGEIVHASWPRFETMLRDRRLSSADQQIMKDIRRRGKNKIAAMNCRRRKQTRVYSLRDERTELNRENEQLEARLSRLQEEERLYDVRLERALRSLRGNGFVEQQQQQQFDDASI